MFAHPAGIGFRSGVKVLNNHEAIVGCDTPFTLTLTGDIEEYPAGSVLLAHITDENERFYNCSNGMGARKILYSATGAQPSTVNILTGPARLDEVFTELDFQALTAEAVLNGSSGQAQAQGAEFRPCIDSEIKSSDFFKFGIKNGMVNFVGEDDSGFIPYVYIKPAMCIDFKLNKNKLVLMVTSDRENGGAEAGFGIELKTKNIKAELKNGEASLAFYKKFDKVDLWTFVIPVPYVPLSVTLSTQAELEVKAKLPKSEVQLGIKTSQNFNYKFGVDSERSQGLFVSEVTLGAEKPEPNYPNSVASFLGCQVEGSITYSIGLEALLSSAYGAGARKFIDKLAAAVDDVEKYTKWVHWTDDLREDITKWTSYLDIATVTPKFGLGAAISAQIGRDDDKSKFAQTCPTCNVAASHLPISYGPFWEFETELATAGALKVFVEEILEMPTLSHTFEFGGTHRFSTQNVCVDLSMGASLQKDCCAVLPSPSPTPSTSPFTSASPLYSPRFAGAQCCQPLAS